MKSNVRIYDNNEASLDRYTAVFMNRKERNTPYFEALGFDAAPYQGIGMHVSAMAGRHLGKRIKLENLPNADCRQFVLENMETGDIL